MDDDPRAMLSHILDLVGALAESLSPEDLPAEAPFPGATLGEVRAELLQVLTRLVEAVNDAPVVPDMASEAGWSSRWQGLRRQLSSAGTSPGVLDQVVVTSSGPRPVRMVLLAQIPVLVLLGWDLAVATERMDELDEDVLRFALAIALRAVPARGRRPAPFLGPVRAVDGNASDGARLAAWLGHRVA
jgi:hypothetical protein